MYFFIKFTSQSNTKIWWDWTLLIISFALLWIHLQFLQILLSLALSLSLSLCVCVCVYLALWRRSLSFYRSLPTSGERQWETHRCVVYFCGLWLILCAPICTYFEIHKSYDLIVLTQLCVVCHLNHCINYTGRQYSYRDYLTGSHNWLRSNIFKKSLIEPCLRHCT
jgi:hypothetical protein